MPQRHHQAVGRRSGRGRVQSRRREQRVLAAARGGNPVDVADAGVAVLAIDVDPGAVRRPARVEVRGVERVRELGRGAPGLHALDRDLPQVPVAFGALAAECHPAPVGRDRRADVADVMRGAVVGAGDEVQRSIGVHAGHALSIARAVAPVKSDLGAERRPVGVVVVHAGGREGELHRRVAVAWIGRHDVDRAVGERPGEAREREPAPVGTPARAALAQRALGLGRAGAAQVGALHQRAGQHLTVPVPDVSGDQRQVGGIDAAAVVEVHLALAAADPAVEITVGAADGRDIACHRLARDHE